MIDEEDLKEMKTAFEEGLEWDGMWTADLLAEVLRLRGLLDEIDEQIYSVVDGLPIEKVNLELLRDIMMSYTDEAYTIRGD